VVTIPAFVWRGGFLRRALLIGGTVGLCLGILAWLDSGMLLGGVVVFVILGTFFGIWMPRRMARHWPAAKQLRGADRVAAVRAARRGERIADVGLARAVIDYTNGLHAAADGPHRLRWLLWLVLVVALGSAVWDTVFGSWGNGVASAIYLVALLVELFWWPKREHQLLANADRAAAIAAHILDRQQAIDADNP
jgi:hypothetical protein